MPRSRKILSLEERKLYRQFKVHIVGNNQKAYRCLQITNSQIQSSRHIKQTFTATKIHLRSRQKGVFLSEIHYDWESCLSIDCGWTKWSKSLTWTRKTSCYIQKVIRHLYSLLESRLLIVPRWELSCGGSFTCVVNGCEKTTHPYPAPRSRPYYQKRIDLRTQFTMAQTRKSQEWQFTCGGLNLLWNSSEFLEVFSIFIAYLHWLQIVFHHLNCTSNANLPKKPNQLYYRSWLPTHKSHVINSTTISKTLCAYRVHHGCEKLWHLSAELMPQCWNDSIRGIWGFVTFYLSSKIVSWNLWSSLLDGQQQVSFHGKTYHSLHLLRQNPTTPTQRYRLPIKNEYIHKSQLFVVCYTPSCLFIFFFLLIYFCCLKFFPRTTGDIRPREANFFWRDVGGQISTQFWDESWWGASRDITSTTL